MPNPQGTTSKETTSKGSTTIDKELYRTKLMAMIVQRIKDINELLAEHA